MLLEKLCNCDGVSGDEDEVRNIIRQQAKGFTEKIETDKLGNLICFRSGARHDKKIMLSAHMDEVGFIISGVTDSGYLKFKTVGGIDTRVILGKRVRFKNGVRGIIGVKAIHLLSKEEEKSVPKISQLYIDIGTSCKDEAKKYVSVGDYACFDTEYEQIGSGRIKAKAVDDRAGCYALLEAMKEKPAFDTYYCFTVQEEVGLRGSGVCAYRIKPNVALVAESTTCSDVYKTKPEQTVTVCGGGAALSYMDRATITDRRLFNALVKMAEKENIPYQLKKTTAGGNDAGSIHLSAGGILTASVSAPCRYIHSPAGVADLRDIDALVSFAKAYCKNIGEILARI